MKALAALVEQLLVRGCGGLGDGRCNPAAGLGNFLITCVGAAHCMLVGARSAEDEMGVAVDQPGRDPGAGERVHLLGAIASELGALADADDLAGVDPDRAVLDKTERIARRLLQASDVAVDEQPVPHAFALRRAGLLRSKRWRALHPLGPTFPS